MTGTLPKLSIVCPVYEEEEVLPHFHRALHAVLAQLECEYAIEVLYVDDGSRDGTLTYLKTLAASDPRVRYLSFSRNFGHQAALTAGLEHARGDLVVTLDADLQHPPELIPALLERWRAGYDIVVTIRAEDPTLGMFKRLTSRAFYRLMRWLSETEIRFAAADFRLMTRQALTAFLQLRETQRFLRGLVQWLGFPTAEVPYQPAPRRAGATKYSLVRMVNLSLDAVLSFSRVPLRLSLGLGGLLLLAGVLLTSGFLTYAGLGRLTMDTSIAVLLSALHLIGGSILVGLGIVGEYVGRIAEQVKGRPLYVLKETAADQQVPLTRDRRANAEEERVDAATIHWAYWTALPGADLRDRRAG